MRVAGTGRVRDVRLEEFLAGATALAQRDDRFSPDDPRSSWSSAPRSTASSSDATRLQREHESRLDRLRRLDATLAGLACLLAVAIAAALRRLWRCSEIRATVDSRRIQVLESLLEAQAMDLALGVGEEAPLMLVLTF